MSSELIDIEMVPEHTRTVSTLQEMSSELQVKAIRYALKYAGKPLVSTMKSTIGQRSGFLASMVNQSQVKAGDPVYASSPEGHKAGKVRLESDEVGIIVGPNKQSARYGYIGMILESGADPHQIGTQYGSLRIGGNFVGSAVQHPGFTGRQIFAPALDKAAGSIESRFYDGLERHLAKLN